MRMKKPIKVSVLKKRLWIIVSKYIRLKEGGCARCGKTDGAIHCHHILSKARKENLRFDEENLISLCMKDHYYGVHGDQQESKKYYEWFNKRYPNRLEDLEKKALRSYRWSRTELQDLIIRYKKKLKELKKDPLL